MTEGRDVETKLVIEAQMKGAQAILQDAKKIKTALGGKDLEKTMQGFAKAAEEVKEQLASSAKGAKELDQALKAYGQSVQGLRAVVDLLKQVNRESERGARSPFLQGMVQGLGITQYVGRGPGMGRQVAGAVAGRGIRQGARFAGHLASSPFLGAQGLQAAMSDVPVLGPLAANQFAVGEQAAGQALQFRRQLSQYLGRARLETPGSWLDMGQVELEAEKRRRSLMETKRQQFTEQEMRRLQAQEQAQLGSRSKVSPGLARQVSGRPSIEAEAGRVVEEKYGTLLSGMGASARQFYIDEQIRKHRERQAGNVAETQRRGRHSAIFALRTIGEEAGYGLPQALQIANQVSTTGGGNPLSARSLSAQQAAIQGLRGFQLDPRVAGQFLYGERRGGFAESFESNWGTGTAMTQALSGAMRMGLEGSELNTYMASIAADISAFRDTGMPISIEAIGAMGKIFAADLGLGSERGGTVAAQFRAAGRSLAMTGPRTGNMDDMQFIRFFGGLSEEQWGNLDAGSLFRAMQNLESGETFTRGNITRYLTTIAKNAGGLPSLRGAGRQDIGRGAAMLQQQLRGRGIRAAPREIEVMLREAAGLPIPEHLRAFAAGREVNEAGATRRAEIFEQQGLSGRATSVLDESMVRQARQINMLIAAGDPLIKSFQDLTDAQRITIDAASKFSGGLEAVTKKIREAAELIGEVATKLANRVPD